MNTLSLRQRGVVLFMALIMLVAMTLMGIALLRSVDSSTLVANNLGFRQSSLVAADLGTELAVRWIENNKGSLISNQDTAGYYATEQTGTDYTGTSTSGDTTDDVDWTGASGSRRACRVKSFTTTSVTCGSSGDAYVDSSGNSVSFIIQRMCDAAGAYSAGSTIQCATSSGTVSTGGSKGAAVYGSYAIASKAMIYYRITTRVTGPRNSTGYLQTMVMVEY